VRTLPINPGTRKRRSLLPAVTVTREWPVNIVPNEEALFYHELVRRFPPVRIRTVRAAKVVPGLGPCYWSGAIREAHRFQSPSWGAKARRALAWWSTSADRSGSDALFWITDAVSSNYFHWLTEVLPKLHLICTLFGECNILLPTEYKDIGFVRQSLEAFREASVSYVTDEKSISISCLKLLSPVAPSGNFNPKVINELRFRLSQYLEVQDVDNRDRTRAEIGIYISRAKANKRKIINETCLVNTIEKLGYHVAFMEDLSLIRQAKLMQGTKVLLGAHGAGLTNMLFMPAGSVVVEIRKEGDSHNNCFFSLASALGHRYYYVTAKCSLSKVDRYEYFAEDFFVDVTRLSTVLRQVAKDCSIHV
jgi:Glycosyltransferase 61